MKFSHIIGAVFLIAALGFAQYRFTPVPWKILKYLGIAITTLIILYLASDYILDAGTTAAAVALKTSRSKEKDYETTIKPIEAPYFVNKQIEETKQEYGRDKVADRKIETDPTEFKQNERFRRITRESPVLGRVMCGIVAAPQNQDGDESVAYVVDLTKPEIRDYSGNLETPGDRENPFNGQYDWLFKDVRDQDEKESGGPPMGIQIDQRLNGEEH